MKNFRDSPRRSECRTKAKLNSLKIEGGEKMLVHTAMTTLLWEATVMLVVIGCVDLGLGGAKNRPKDMGIVLLCGAILETLALAFVINGEAYFDALIASAFILVLWYLGLGLIIGENRFAMQHANVFTGVLFTAIAIYCGAILGEVVLTIGLAFLPPVLWASAASAYLGKPSIAKIGGGFAFIDAFVFFALAFCNGINFVLP
jgi:hypothetical protein